MDYLTTEEKVRFLKANIEADETRFVGTTYRAAAYLTDGTFLPCVRFLNPKAAIKAAIDRFERGRKGELVVNDSPGLGFRLAVQNIVAHGNRVNHYDVARIERSRFAFPPAILEQITGETTMGWTGFSARMRDGRYFGFGSPHGFEFFAMPEGYASGDIAEIINHSYVSSTGELRPHRRGFLAAPPDYREAVIHQALPFFDCFMQEI